MECRIEEAMKRKSNYADRLWTLRLAVTTRTEHGKPETQTDIHCSISCSGQRLLSQRPRIYSHRTILKEH
jgi:hypothetical protein